MKQRTVGDILREERLSHRFTIPDLAKRTRIRQEYLEALESNNFEKLPAATFVKGYIKNYAQLFDFDAEPVLAILRRDFKESSKGKLVPREFLSSVIKKRGRAKPFRYVVLAIGLAFLTIVSYIGLQWWRFQQPPSLAVFSPDEFANVGPQVVVSGETEESARLSINDQPVALKQDGTFEYELIMQSEGLKTIEVTVVDEKGRVTTEVLQIQVSF